MIDVGHQLRSARVSRGLSQRELADRAGTTQAIVSRVERGLHIPTVDMLSRLYGGMGEQIHVTRLPASVDALHLAEELRLPMSERIERAFTWMRFNAALHGSAARAAEAGR